MWVVISDINAREHGRVGGNTLGGQNPSKNTEDEEVSDSDNDDDEGRPSPNGHTDGSQEEEEEEHPLFEVDERSGSQHVPRNVPRAELPSPNNPRRGISGGNYNVAGSFGQVWRLNHQRIVPQAGNLGPVLREKVDELAVGKQEHQVARIPNKVLVSPNQVAAYPEFIERFTRKLSPESPGTVAGA